MGNLVRIGVIGVGKLGSFHCEKLKTIETAELVGVHDADEQRADQISQKFQVPAFTSIDALLDQVSAVSIAVPTVDHLRISKFALERGLPVFVEKPIAANVSQATEMVNLAQQHHTIIQVGHVERFNPALLALSGFTIKPLFIESHRLAPFDPRGTDVAVVLDLMIHDIDIILAMVRSPVVQIDANGVALVSDEADIANARIRFANGCIANVTASRISQRKMRKIRIFQKDAYISIDFLQRNTEIFRIQDDLTDPGQQTTVILGQIEKGKRPCNILYERPALPEKDALYEELASFIAAVRNGSQPVVSGEDGLRALEVAVKVAQIVKESQHVIS